MYVGDIETFKVTDTDSYNYTYSWRAYPTSVLGLYYGNGRYTSQGVDAKSAGTGKVYLTRSYNGHSEGSYIPVTVKNFGPIPDIMITGNIPPWRLNESIGFTLQNKIEGASSYEWVLFNNDGSRVPPFNYSISKNGIKATLIVKTGPTNVCYQLRARAQNKNGVISDWTKPHYVTIH